MYETGQIPANTKLQDRYIIIDSAGKGGMGHVYKALDSKVQQRIVAIKEMGQKKLTEQEREDAQKRFAQEARISDNLSHPNLPNIHGLFEDQGRFFIVMDFIDGKTLQQLINEASDGHRLPIEDVLQYAIQLCDVLAYLHNQSPPIIFRDLKPSNVMITTDGHVYLIDFGIARSYKPEQSMDTELFGSWGFCPPELVSQQTEPRSDLFSLGATLYYCLTGRHPKMNKPTPFDFPSLQASNQEVPNILEDLILSCVATKVEQRPPNAGTVRQQLTHIQHWMHSSTTTWNMDPNKHNMGSLYDAKTARTTLVQYWLTRFNTFPGWFNKYWLMIIPFFAKVGGATWTWCSTVLLPFCYHLGNTLLSAGKDMHLRFSSAMSGQPRSSPVLNFWLQVSSWTTQVRQARAWFPLIAVLLLASFYSMRVLLFQHGSLSTIACALGLFLLLLIFTACMDALLEKQQGSYALLVTSGVGVFLLCLTLLTGTDLRAVIAAQTAHSLFFLLILFLSILALVPFAHYFSWIDHCLLIVVAGLYMLQQYVFGIQPQQQIPFVNADLALLINNLLLVLMGIVILISLLSLPFKVSFLHRLLFVAVVLIAVEQQGIFGMQELNAGLGAAPPLAVVILNVLVIGLLIVSVPLSFRISSATLSSRFPLLFVAATNLLLQQFLGLPAHQQTLFTENILSALNFQNLLAWLFILIAFLLFISVFKKHKFVQLDSIALFGLALMCLLFLFPLQGQWDTTDEASLYPVALYIIFASLLVVALVSEYVFLFVSASSSTVRQNMSFGKGQTKIERRKAFCVQLVIALTCIGVTLAQWLFGKDEVLFISIQLGSQENSSFTLDRVLFVVLAVLASIAVIKLCSFKTRHVEDDQSTFSGLNRLLVLVSVIACIFLLFTTQDHMHYPLQRIEQWGGTFFAPLPALLVVCTFVAATIVALLWLRYAPSRLQRILSLIVLSAILLQIFWPAAMLVGLFALMQEVLLTIYAQEKLQKQDE